MKKIIWVVVKSYFYKGRMVHREIYGYSNKRKECNKMLRDYKYIVLNNREPFMYNTKKITGIHNSAGLDVRSDDKLITFRIIPTTIMMF